MSMVVGNLSSKREEFKGRLKAMRIRIKKKRERFMSALKTIDSLPLPAHTNLFEYEDDKIIENELMEQNHHHHDTIRSMEVSFVGHHHQNGSQASANLPKSRHSIVSRTSTPIFVKSIGPVSSVFVAGHMDSSNLTPRSRKCCPRKMNGSSIRMKSSGGGGGVKFGQHGLYTNDMDYLSSSMSSSSYMTSMTGGRFQNCGEFKVWFV